jgi:hypothetical protein
LSLIPRDNIAGNGNDAVLGHCLVQKGWIGLGTWNPHNKWPNSACIGE